jgi:hypothetical protein
MLNINTEVGIEVYAEKTKNIFMSRHQTVDEILIHRQIANIYRTSKKEGNTFTCSVYKTPFVVESPFFNTFSPGVSTQNTFPHQLQTNFESFPNN